MFSFEAIDEGWYKSTGNHIPGNTNYFVGDNGEPLTNNYFLFDLQALSIPLGEHIVSAHLTLTTFAVQSNDVSETLVLYDVTSDLSTLSTATSSVATYNDLGSGTIYGSHDYFEMFTSPTESIPLDEEARAGIAAAVGSRFAIGGSIATLDGKLATQPDEAEWIFGNSSGAGVQRLDIVTDVPEPTLAVTTVCVAVASVMRVRTRRRKQFAVPHAQ